MKRTPRVTIGVPTYNAGNYLERALTSILDQTFADFEIVISDNDSSDDTVDIAESFAARDDRIRLLRSQVNVGANRNFNRCVHAGSGEYFKWAAHDDELAPRYLEACIERLDTDPGVVLCHSETVLIDAASEPLVPVGRGFVGPDGFVEAAPEGRAYFDRAGDPDPVRRLEAQFYDLVYVSPQFGVIRRNVLGDTQLFGNFYGTDKVFLGELALRGRFAMVDEPLWMRRCHAATSTRKASDSDQQTWADPTNGKAWYPFEMTKEYAKAIEAAPLSASQRRRARAALTRKTLQPRQWRRLIQPGDRNIFGWGR